MLSAIELARQRFGGGVCNLLLHRRDQLQQWDVDFTAADGTHCSAPRMQASVWPSVMPFTGGSLRQKRESRLHAAALDDHGGHAPRVRGHRAHVQAFPAQLLDHLPRGCIRIPAAHVSLQSAWHQARRVEGRTRETTAQVLCRIRRAYVAS